MRLKSIKGYVVNNRGFAGRQNDRAYLVDIEGNVEDYPDFTADNQRTGERVLRYSSTVRITGGQELEQSWIVGVVHGLGLPEGWMRVSTWRTCRSSIAKASSRTMPYSSPT